jgi:hypothetical protein
MVADLSCLQSGAVVTRQRTPTFGPQRLFRLSCGLLATPDERRAAAANAAAAAAGAASSSAAPPPPPPPPGAGCEHFACANHLLALQWLPRVCSLSKGLSEFLSAGLCVVCALNKAGEAQPAGGHATKLSPDVCRTVRAVFY